MDFDEGPQDAEFRATASAWLDEHGDRPEATAARRADGEDAAELLKRARPWQALLADHGWAAITWPAEFGGRGGTPTQQAIFRDEATRRGLPVNTFMVGTGLAGPTIIAHGTPRQQDRYLAPMLRGDEVWCQLFSEPGAGSDLAALSTRATIDGDSWNITGQKVWTTSAEQCDYGLLLARTDPDVPKHRGITCFLIDMHQPGVEVRPLRQMTGSAHFSEVFFDDARVGADDVVGGVGGGWAAAMTTLANERNFMGGASPGPGIDDLLALAQTCGASTDPVFRQHLAAAYTRAGVIGYLGMQVRTATEHGVEPGPAASVLKLMAARDLKLCAELALAMQGAAGMLDDRHAMQHGLWQQSFLVAPSMRIAGGSDEIQRNIIGERILGLPSEPRVDKLVPFRDVPRDAPRG